MGREGITTEIHMTEWNSYFMVLLGEVETRLTALGGEGGGGGEEIAEEEMEAVLRGLKKGKAPGGDGIHNEAWLEPSRVVRVKLLEGMNSVWRGGGIPEGWIVGVICPVYKKGNKGIVDSYRGINLLDSAYKVYTKVLLGRLKEEMKGGIFPDGQNSPQLPIDNMYVLKHLADRELDGGQGEVVGGDGEQEDHGTPNSESEGNIHGD
nr:uncharacterized protein LOC111421515 [Onthophagus taurus]